ncbi:hypothetical protein [Schumannella sp. 10F1B-5-1]|uniref:hypothetical protein n=1 Tax=Schumannella sp. 10F1B-5-1 TaxID=2590780 RepID=UPI0011300AAB|nr:hypothetical protein [Schumannella sp. 10F1B-5-1]TPW76889.1 hypothetical protein FJ658_02875 [Schumannella sp. 10F1B-5-1]
MTPGGGLSDEERARLAAAPPPLVEPPEKPQAATPPPAAPEPASRVAHPAPSGARSAPPPAPAAPASPPAAASSPAPDPHAELPETEPLRAPGVDTGALPSTAPITAADLAHTDPTTLPPELHLESALAIDGAPGAMPAAGGSALMDELFAPDRFVEWDEAARASTPLSNRAGPPTTEHIPSGLTGPQPSHDPWARTRAALAAAQEADARELAAAARYDAQGTPIVSRTQKSLVVVAVAVVSLLALVSLFLLGTRLPVAGAEPTAGASGASSGQGDGEGGVDAVPTGPVKSGDHAWTALNGGECLDPFTDPWAEEFTVVRCVDEHDAQLVLRAPIPDADAQRWPGVDALQIRLTELCAAAGVIDLTSAGAYSDLQLSAAFPASAAQWRGGERDYFCFVSRSSGKKIEGSVQGTAQAGVWAAAKAAAGPAKGGKDGDTSGDAGDGGSTKG